MRIIKEICLASVLLILFPGFIRVASAQPGKGMPPGGGRMPMGNFSRPNMPTTLGRISGTLIDSLKNPVEFASAAIYIADGYEPVTGVITNEKGAFVLKNVPVENNYTMEISYVGFKKIRIKNVTLTASSPDIRLGEIILLPSSEMLKEVTITGNQQSIAYKIDRKVISVSQDIVAMGGSVVDALENVPSVKTDINGDVTIRGSGTFTVLIDGKPSVLKGSEALQQIPANAVENIEIITNPSARYDPDGDVGIINVIMKKKFTDGLSAIINTSAGIPTQYGFDVSSSYRTEKGTLTAALDYRNRDMDMDGVMYRETYFGDSTSTQKSDITGGRGRENLNFRLGYTANLGIKNSLTFQANVGQRTNNNFSINQNIFGSIPESTFYYQLADSRGINEGSQYSFNGSFTRNFNLNGHKLDLGTTFMGTVGKADTYLDEYETSSEWEIVSKSFSRDNLENNDNRQFRFNVDYVRPLEDGGKLEAGYQTRLENTDSEFEFLEIENEDELNTTNDLRISRNIQSLYGVYGNKIQYLGYQIGLRAEYTGRNVNQKTTDEEFVIDRVDLFPSIHLSYKLVSGEELQASYSRRVNRPRSRMLNPFPMYLDSRNLRVGNPNLEPEFTDSYEVNFLKQFVMSFVSVEAFYRSSNNVISRVQVIDNNGIVISTYENLNKDKSYGIEGTASFQLFEWWRIMGSTSVFQYSVEGEIAGENTDNSSLAWNGRLMSMFTLPKNFRIQLNGIYNSDKASAQGTRSGFIMTNVAVRKNLWNNKLGVTLQVRDLFQQMNFAGVSSSGLFYSENEFRPRTPMFSVNISLKLNNYKKTRSRYGSNTDVMEMDYQTDFTF